MSESKNHNRSYNAEDIRRYLGGKMSREEMHAMEEASLNDPFLADALEGYSNISESHANASIRELAERLQDRSRVKIIPIGHSKKWWRIAKAAIVILVAGFASYFLITNPAENTSIAQRETPAVKDSGMDRKSFSNDSTVISPPVAAQAENVTESEKKVEEVSSAIIQKKR